MPRNLFIFPRASHLEYNPVHAVDRVELRAHGLGTRTMTTSCRGKGAGDRQAQAAIVGRQNIGFLAVEARPGLGVTVMMSTLKNS